MNICKFAPRARKHACFSRVFAVSACILGAAVANAAHRQFTVTLGYDGAARVIGAAIDIGCYEDDNIPMPYLLR